MYHHCGGMPLSHRGREGQVEGDRAPTELRAKKTVKKGKKKGKKTRRTVVAGAGAATCNSLPSTWMHRAWCGTYMRRQCHTQQCLGVLPVLHTTLHCAVEGQVL